MGSRDRRTLSPTKILAVASAGGHWIQLMRLQPIFIHYDCVFVSTRQDLQRDVSPRRFIQVPDMNRNDLLGLVPLVFRLARIVQEEKPSIVLTTGAAPGLLAVAFGRCVGATTIWIDSLANTERLSLSGRLAKRCSTHWLTQWSHLASSGGPKYLGRVF